MSRTADDAEFADFVERTTSSLRTTAWLLTGEREAAADLLQVSFVKTYLAWRRVRRDDAQAYTRKVMVNLAIDTWRTKHDTPVGDTFDRPDGAPGTSAVDDRDEVVRMLTTLPPRQRAVIVLRYLHDLSEASTAQELGISVGAVKSACSRGLAALRAADRSTPSARERTRS